MPSRRAAPPERVTGAPGRLDTHSEAADCRLVERLRWALLATAAVAGAACVGAAVDPALGTTASVAVVLMGLVCSAVLWLGGRSRSTGRRGWRLLAVTPLFPVLGAAFALLAEPTAPLQVAIF